MVNFQTATSVQNNLHALFEQAPTGISIFRGPELVVEMINDIMLAYLNRERHEVLDQPAFHALPELKGQGLEEILYGVYASGKSSTAAELPVTLLRRGSPETIYIKFTMTPLRDETGGITGLMAMAHDITDQVSARKKAEEKEAQLKESEARFRSLAENSPDVITRHDEQHRYLYASPRIEKFTGIRAEEFPGKTYWELGMPPELCAFFDHHLAFTFTHRSLHTVEYEMPGGGYIHSRMVPEFDQHGRVASVLVLSTDISEIRKAATELRYRTALLEAQNETIPDGLLVVDTKGKMLYHNRKFARMWNIPQSVVDDNNDEAALGLAMNQLKEPQAFMDRVNYLYAHASESSHEEVHFKDGRVFERYGNAVTGADGTRYGWLWYFRDITLQKRFSLELENRVYQRTLELEQKNTELEQFAYIASHDLQEPLRKIIMFSGVLQEKGEALTQSDRNYLEKVIKASRRMSSLIRDILNFSRLNGSDHNMQPTDLNTVLQNVLEDLELEIAQKQASVHSDPLALVMANPVHMHQLFFNLVGNALKFSRPGEAPRLAIRCEPLSDELRERHRQLLPGDAYCRLLFTDNGIGFEQEHADQIFTVFQRLNGASEYAGTGIGLALCRKIVSGHGGVIYAESEPGQGSSFSVVLPLAEAARVQ